MHINIQYGIESMTKNFDGDAIPVSQVLNNAVVKATLGFGDNVRALTESGAELSPSSVVYDGDTVVVETKANSKAEATV
jgi:hypothetical protein